jgi:hypothetical protein
MSRTAMCPGELGTDLIGLGTVLVAIAAVLKYAVTLTTTGIDVNAVGVILLIVPICTVIMGPAASRAARPPSG